MNIFGSNLLFVLPLLLELVFYHKNTKRKAVFIYFFVYIFDFSRYNFYKGYMVNPTYYIFVVLLSKKYKALIIAFTVGG